MMRSPSFQHIRSTATITTSTTSATVSRGRGLRGFASSRVVVEPQGVEERLQRLQEGHEPQKYFRFEVVHESKRSGARVGLLHTPHGTVITPAFVAVATNAALKFQDHRCVTSTTTTTVNAPPK